MPRLTRNLSSATDGAVTAANQPVIAFLRGLLTHLLIAILALGSLSSAASVFAANGVCTEEACPCDAAATGDVHGSHAAEHEHDAHEDEEAASESEVCSDTSAPCQPGCDDCHCSVSSGCAVLTTLSPWLPARSGFDLAIDAVTDERIAHRSSDRLERPPRSVLC